jgi:hypothetical protein
MRNRALNARVQPNNGRLEMNHPAALMNATTARIHHEAGRQAYTPIVSPSAYATAAHSIGCRAALNCVLNWKAGLPPDEAPPPGRLVTDPVVFRFLLLARQMDHGFKVESLREQIH